jgi:hypothetical protein
VTPQAPAATLSYAWSPSQLDGVVFEHDHVLGEHAVASLPKPSLVRVAKLVTVEETMLLKRLGALSKRDRASVRQNLEALFGLA